MQEKKRFSTENCLKSIERIADILAPETSFRKGLMEMLGILAGDMHFHRPHIIVQDPVNGCLRLSLSLAEAESPEESYAPGDGATGEAYQSDRPVIVPCMKDRPDFGNRLFGRSPKELSELAFLSVPVHVVDGGNRRVIGVLSCDTPRASSGELGLQSQYLQAVAALVGGQVAWLQEDLARRRFRCSTLAEANPLPGSIVACSKSMRQVLRLVRQVAPSHATVLLRGESGVGKELMAKAVHEASPRRLGPLVSLNCAAIPDSLVEGELFGWRKGAFSGAISNHRGVFLQAEKGTLFLDEIGELPLSAQSKLLRVLQDGMVQQLGSEESTHADVRIVCATNRPLEDMAADGRFRQDLLYRINIFPIYIPALRERVEDVIPLACHYVEAFAREYGKKAACLSPPAMELLRSYSWPGNIRELKNAMERAVLLCDEDAVRSYHLPSAMQRGPATRPMRDGETGFAETVERLERDLLEEALRSAAGNIHQAARNAGLTYRVMQYKVKKYGIDWRSFTHPKR